MTSTERAPSPAFLDPARFPVVEHRLANGLQVRILEKRNVPTVSLYTFFRVGSRNERPGRTGMAHFFEHMMFNGAEKYGPKEFDRVLESLGGTSNAYTSNDLTVYFEDFPSEALETVIDLEADRMRSLAIDPAMFESEREVVKEERRYRVDNDVFGTMEESLSSLMFRAHPYRWPVIGWMKDLDAITREDALAFFRTFYAPNNALIFAVGDLRADRAIRWIEERYGDIPPGPPAPEVVDAEPEPLGERRARVRFPSHAPALLMGYKTLPARDPDAQVLEVIATALGTGESSRLVQRLVYERELASDITLGHDRRIDPSAILVFADLEPGAETERVEEAILEEIGILCREGLDAGELRRAKAILRSAFLASLATHGGLAHTLGEEELLLGDWREAFRILERIEGVGPDDVKRLAGKIFDESNRSVVTMEPKLP